MLTFLEINGHAVHASDRELADWIIGLSGATTVHVLRERVDDWLWKVLVEREQTAHGDCCLRRDA